MNRYVDDTLLRDRSCVFSLRINIIVSSFPMCALLALTYIITIIIIKIYNKLYDWLLIYIYVCVYVCEIH